MIRGAKGADGKVRPVFELQTTEPEEEKIGQFLRGEITVDGEEDPEGGFLVDEDIEEKDGVTYPEGEGLWLHSFVKSEEAPWAVEQVCNSKFVCLKYHANSVYRSGALRLSTANATTAVASSSQLKRANTSLAVWSMTTKVSRRLQRRVDGSFLYFLR